MEAPANSLLSPITAAADRSESTTILVAKVNNRAPGRASSSSKHWRAVEFPRAPVQRAGRSGQPRGSRRQLRHRQPQRTSRAAARRDKGCSRVVQKLRWRAQFSLFLQPQRTSLTAARREMRGSWAKGGRVRVCTCVGKPYTGVLPGASSRKEKLEEKHDKLRIDNCAGGAPHWLRKSVLLKIYYSTTWIMNGA